MKKELFSSDYKVFLKEIKSRIASSQIKAAIAVNEELLRLYWDLAQMILVKQEASSWGDGLLAQIGADLKSEFPDMKGFSLTNLKYMKQWYIFWTTQTSISQQVVDQLFKIPWGHHIAIITKVKNSEEAVFYLQKTVEHNYSRSVLIHQIENKLYGREGKAITNFSMTLPAPNSDLAHQTLKDPYMFDFLNMREDYDERELESSLVAHVTKGILICKSKNDTVVEYALKDINKPIGVSEYVLMKSLPKEFKSSLPTIEEIEAEMGDFDRGIQ